MIRSISVLEQSLLCLTITMLSASMVLTAQAITQPTLKAAFLFNFGKFVEWPEGASETSPLAVCVLDDAPVEESLEQLINGSPIGGRPVTVVKGARHRSLRVCDVLYIGDSDSARAALTLDELKGAPILTVGDGDQFARSGGMIGLFIEDGRMRFAINPDAAVRAGLRLDSRLLSLAKIVKEGRHGQS